jgi:hypothetical protein
MPKNEKNSKSATIKAETKILPKKKKKSIMGPDTNVELNAKKLIDQDSDCGDNITISTPEYDISITPFNTPSPLKQVETCDQPYFEMQVSSNTPFTLKLHYQKYFN